MKRLFFLAAFAMMSMAGANAQQADNGYNNTKHEIGISIGGLSNSQWIDIFEDVLTTVVGATYEDSKFTGPFSAEYFYRMKNWLGVGGILVYGRSTQDMKMFGSLAGEVKHSYFTVMPAVKFDWLRKKYFGMYSKLGLGATLRSESVDSHSDNVSDSSDSNLEVNWQVSALGLEVGAPKVRAFFEFGTGEQGVFIIGLRGKF